MILAKRFRVRVTREQWTGAPHLNPSWIREMGVAKSDGSQVIGRQLLSDICHCRWVQLLRLRLRALADVSRFYWLFLLADKAGTLKLGIQLGPILPRGSRKKIPRVLV